MSVQTSSTDDDLVTVDASPRHCKIIPLVVRSSMDNLLASWGAVQSPTSVSKMRRLSGRRAEVSYAVSPSSSPEKSDTSVFEDVQEPSGDVSHEEREASDDELISGETIRVMPRTPSRAPQESRSTRQLRSRPIDTDIKYARRVTKRASRTKPLPKTGFPLSSDTTRNTKAPKVETARNRVRNDILGNTKPKRDAFLLYHKDYFTPLLSPNNYINKLERTMTTPDEICDAKPLQQPEGVTADMKPYQLDGLSFLVHMHDNGMSAILGDEMGLGKTLQTLSLFQYLRESSTATGEPRPNLVICPLSVLSSWMSETRKWVPSLKVVRFHGPKSERERFKKECTWKKSASEKLNRTISSSPDLVVTTYETFTAERSWFTHAAVWRYCVLDEGHKIKNEKTNIAAALQGLSAEFRLLLTGTPIQNNLKEGWALLHWLFPEVFTDDTADAFCNAFDLTKGNVSTEFMDNVRRLLELIMLRRMKTSSGVNLGLPPKEEILLFVPLTPMQRFWYTRLLTRVGRATLDDLFSNVQSKEAANLASDNAQLERLEKVGMTMDNIKQLDAPDVWAESRAIMQEVLREETEEKGGDWRKLMNLLMQLRKACSHPYLLPSAAPEIYDVGDHIIKASGKFIVLDKLIDELVVKQRKKILIFSGFTRTLDLVGELLSVKGANSHEGAFKFARLDGGTARAQRNLGIRMFNDKRTQYQVMLLSTRAGGLGINLTSATDVVFMDEDWNPQVTLQAEARAHRIGQTEKVTVYKLCSQGTVEEQMMGRIRKKLYLSAKITESMRNIHAGDPSGKKRKRQPEDQDGLQDDAPHLDAASLQSLIRRGAQTLARPQVDVTEMLGWDWQTVLDKCKDRPADVLVGDQSESAAAEAEQEWLNSMERVECAVFEGRKHQKELEERVSRVDELNRVDRRAGKNTTVEINGFMISKQSLNCDAWEAVPTFAGKDPSLAEFKREKKAAISHQDWCQCCWGTVRVRGDPVRCKGCPRAYHRLCLPREHQIRSAGTLVYYCPQHECTSCSARTGDAGGMIYRCRWCERGFCEDCLDWDAAQPLDDSLPEFETRLFPSVAQAFFIECPHCIRSWAADPGARQAMVQAKQKFTLQLRKFLKRRYPPAPPPPPPPPAGDADAIATPSTVSEVLTPADKSPPAPPKQVMTSYVFPEIL